MTDGRMSRADGRTEIEQRGLWFEDFDESAVYLHRPGRTVTEADNVLFTTLTMNPQALHLDAAWSAQQPFGRPLVNSLFTLSTLVGLSVGEVAHEMHVPEGTVKARLSRGRAALARGQPEGFAELCEGQSRQAELRILG